MMLRLVCAAMAAAGSAALGYALSAAAARRARMVHGAVWALRALETAICDRHDLLADALSALPGGDPAQRAWAAAFAALGAQTRDQPALALAQGWQRVLGEMPELAVLTPDDLALLSPLWVGLGRGDAREQRALLDAVQRELSARHAQLAGSMKDTQRLYQSLGTLGGLCLFLLLM